MVLPGGLELRRFDTEETIRSFDDSWKPPQGGGHRVAFGSRVTIRPMWTRPTPLTGSGSTATCRRGRVWGQRYAIVLDPDGNHVGSPSLPAS